MSGKSATCNGKKTGKPLTEYDTEQEAREGVDYARQRYQSDLVPYLCDTCGKWHLSPTSRQTPSQKCPTCTGADRRPKDSYQTEEDARRRADILRREQGALLRVYPCEHGHGWHLTRG
ncbi:hypothetical protein ACFL6X_04745 [Candidatus Latescibacterota bacterium]